MIRTRRSDLGEGGRKRSRWGEDAYELITSKVDIAVTIVL